MTDIQRVLCKNFNLELTIIQENEYFFLGEEEDKFILFLLSEIDKIPQTVIDALKNKVNKKQKKYYVVLEYAHTVVLKNDVFSIGSNLILDKIIGIENNFNTKFQLSNQVVFLHFLKEIS